MDKIKIKPRLKQDYQLSNYCPTEGNYIAVSAAKAVISEWGKTSFNPLFLLGPTITCYRERDSKEFAVYLCLVCVCIRIQEDVF